MIEIASAQNAIATPDGDSAAKYSYYRGMSIVRMHEIAQLLHEQHNSEYYAGDFEGLNTSANRSDTRRPRLTLLHLQRIRQHKDAAEYDHLQHLEMLPDMYGVIKVKGKWQEA